MAGIAVCAVVDVAAHLSMPWIHVALGVGVAVDATEDGIARRRRVAVRAGSPHASLPVPVGTADREKRLVVECRGLPRRC